MAAFNVTDIVVDYENKCAAVTVSFDDGSTKVFNAVRSKTDLIDQIMQYEQFLSDLDGLQGLLQTDVSAQVQTRSQ